MAVWLGHSQASTTSDLYGKAIKARERQATERVDAFYAAFVTPQLSG